jgi:hypothetical protein
LEVVEVEVAGRARAATMEGLAVGLEQARRRRCGAGGLGAAARRGGGAADGREGRPAKVCVEASRKSTGALVRRNAGWGRKI